MLGRQAAFAVVALLALARPSPTAELTGQWAHWRGPSQQGYSDDARAPLTWSDTHNLLWKTRLPGVGNSSPIVWGDRIFLTASSPKGDERLVLCVRAADGKVLWQRVASRGVEAGLSHKWNGFASASCTTDGERVYAFFGTPGLYCYDFDGTILWKHAFGVFTAKTGWGTSASPFLYEDLLIQNCDTDGPSGLTPGADANTAAVSALVALDKKTGEIRWQTPRNQGFGFSTPVLIPAPDGRPELVLNGQHGVWAYDPRTGKELWHCLRHPEDGGAKFGEPLPVFNRETLYGASGRPGPLQAVRLGGAGDVSKSHLLWEVVRKGCRDVASPILWGDALFAADRSGFLSAHDLKTGQFLFKERVGAKPVCASPVALRGKLLFTVEDGTTLVVEPARTLKIVGRNKLTDPTEFRASPAVADGRLYLRSQSHLYCIGEKK